VPIFVAIVQCGPQKTVAEEEKMPKEMLRQGGRSARIQTEVHRAVEELSAKMDRSALTVPLIAERAGVTPSTIYRRWGDLGQLLADVAVRRLRPIADPEDTGSARSDLEAWVLQYAEEMSSRVGRALLRDVLSTSEEPAYATQCWRYTHAHLTTLAERAGARGERPFDVHAVVDRIVAPIVYHILFNDRGVAPEYCRELVDALAAEEIRPTARRTAARVKVHA
jgi:AcrR family transcriptional regulator